jgi:hypothetical protein
MATCVYVVDPAECANSGVPANYWYQMPPYQPVHFDDTGADIWSAMFLWHLMYAPWYASPAYYNTYVPTRYRATYVTQHVTVFDNRYRSMEDRYASRAIYRSGSGKTVTGNKLDRTKLSTQINTGGNRSGRTSKGNGCLVQGGLQLLGTTVADALGPQRISVMRPGGGSGGGGRSGSSSKTSSRPKTSSRGTGC